MLRVGAIILVGLLATACTSHKTTRIPLAINANAMTEMRATTSLLQKRDVASLNCRRAGYRKRTTGYYQCMRALIARDLQRTRESAESNLQEAARQGVCMDRATFRVARCLEI